MDCACTVAHDNRVAIWTVPRIAASSVPLRRFGPTVIAPHETLCTRRRESVAALGVRVHCARPRNRRRFRMTSVVSASARLARLVLCCGLWRTKERLPQLSVPALLPAAYNTTHTLAACALLRACACTTRRRTGLWLQVFTELGTSSYCAFVLWRLRRCYWWIMNASNIGMVAVATVLFWLRLVSHVVCAPVWHVSC